MRIISNEFYPRTGGIATYVEGMARALAGMGHEVQVSCPRFSDRPPEDAPYRIEQRPSRGTQDPDDLWKLRRVLKAHLESAMDEILFLAEPAPIRALLLFQKTLPLKGRRIWLAVYGSEVVQLAGNPVWRRLMQRLSPHIERVATISEYTADLVRQHFPQLGGRIRVTLPGIDPTWRHLDKREPPIPGKCVHLLTAARLHPRKGQIDVLQALREIPEEILQSIQYQIVGKGRNRAYIDQLKKAAAACSCKVELLGERRGEALRGAYQAADIFIMASRDHPRSLESFGIVYLEAAAAGLPIIAADVGGVREALIPGETAVLVPPGDSAALRKAIQQLAGDPERRRSMGEAGRRFSQQFTWERAARQLIED